MTEKEVLQNIPLHRMEAKSMLKLVSYLQNSGKGDYDREVNKWLDRLHYLDELDRILTTKKD